MSRCVVIGAGLGGLSAACHLAGAGHDVTVVERHHRPGGRAGSLQLGGYRFDTGPTVLTMPELFERCFRAVGVDMSSLLTVRPLDPMYRACFADGSELRVLHGRQAMAAEIADVCGPTEAAAFDRFADWLTELFRCEMPGFIERNYDSPLDLVRPLGPSAAAAAPGRLPTARGLRGALLPRRAVATLVQLSVAVRRPRSPPGARRVRGDHLHGRDQRRRRHRWRRSRRCPRRWRRRPSAAGPSSATGPPPSASSPNGRMVDPCAACDSTRVNCSAPTSWCATPTCRGPTAPCCLGSSPHD